MRKSREYPHQSIYPTIFLYLALTLGFAGCHKSARIVPVTDEDVRLANEAAKEAENAFARKDYYAALIKYLESTKLNPNNGYVYNRLGIAWLQLQYYEEAIAVFTRSMELNPKYPFPYNNLGTVYFAQKNIKKAEKYFKKAISLKSDDASFHMNLGSVYFERKKREKAMAEWRKGLDLDRNVLNKSISVSLVGGTTALRERQYHMARLLASSGDLERSIENLQLAFSNGFDDIDLIRKEPDFNKIRNDVRFAEFMEKAAQIVKLRAKSDMQEK